MQRHAVGKHLQAFVKEGSRLRRNKRYHPCVMPDLCTASCPPAALRGKAQPPDAPGKSVMHD